MQVLLSSKLWILGMTLSLYPGISEVGETGYPDLGTARNISRFILRLPSPETLAAGTSGKENL